jgi:hypothetical protein
MGGVGVTDQLRPDPVPVIRPQVPTTNGATSRTLDFYAALNGHRPIATNPLTNSRLPNSDRFGQCGLAANNFDGSLYVVHAASIGNADASGKRIACYRRRLLQSAPC